MLKLFEDSSMEKIAVVTDTGSNLSFEQAKELVAFAKQHNILMQNN